VGRQEEEPVQSRTQRRGRQAAQEAEEAQVQENSHQREEVLKEAFRAFQSGRVLPTDLRIPVAEAAAWEPAAVAAVAWAAAELQQAGHRMIQTDYRSRAAPPEVELLAATHIHHKDSRELLTQPTHCLSQAPASFHLLAEEPEIEPGPGHQTD
jgi:hypothetical protein